MWRSRLWSVSWLCHQMFYLYVTISAAQARESDDLRHAMSPFSLFLSSFSGVQRILGYVRPRRIVVLHPPKTEEGAFGGAFAQRCDVIGLQMLLRRMQILNWDTTTMSSQFNSLKQQIDFLSLFLKSNSNSRRNLWNQRNKNVFLKCHILLNQNKTHTVI